MIIRCNMGYPGAIPLSHEPPPPLLKRFRFFFLLDPERYHTVNEDGQP